MRFGANSNSEMDEWEKSIHVKLFEMNLVVSL